MYVCMYVEYIYVYECMYERVLTFIFSYLCT